MELGMWRMLRSSPCTALRTNPPRYSGAMRLPLQGEAVGQSQIDFNLPKSKTCCLLGVSWEQGILTCFPVLHTWTECVLHLRVRKLKVVHVFQHFTCYFVSCTRKMWSVFHYFIHTFRLHVSLSWSVEKSRIQWFVQQAGCFQVPWLNWMVGLLSWSLQILYSMFLNLN